MERYMSNELHKPNKSVRNFLERSAFCRGILKALAVFGVSLILADGILTPAQSVLGAIQGLKVVKEDISTDTIVGVSCAIIVLLYLAQPLGIHKLGSAFAPVVVLWLIFNFVFGIYVCGFRASKGWALLIILEPREIRPLSSQGIFTIFRWKLSCPQ
jgi:KUP system potassium uptake protein